MPKLFGKKFGWPTFREQVSALDAGTSQGLFRLGSTVTYKPKEIQSYYDAYLDQDLIRAMVDDLAEAVAGQGFYTKVETLTPVFQKSKPKELVDHFCMNFDLDSLLVNVCKNILVAGFCPVNMDLRRDVEKCALKIVHPLTVTDIQVDPQTGEVSQLIQKVGVKEVKIDGRNLAWFDYGRLGNDARGTSYLRSIIGLLNTLNKATANVDAILDRYISPLGIWRSQRSIESIKKAVDEREAGEDIFLGNLTEQEMAAKDGIVEFLQIDPRVPFWEYIEYLDRRVFSASRANNLWYSLQRSEASAEETGKIVDRHVASIQRGMKRAVEKYWFAPLIKLNDLDEVPKLNFGIEPTGVQNINVEPFLTKGLEIGYVTQTAYNDILKQLGVKVPEEMAEPSGSATPPSDESIVQSLVHEQVTLSGGTWACPKCGYTLANAMVSPQFIICPKCGFEPDPHQKKTEYLKALMKIVGKYNEIMMDETG